MRKGDFMAIFEVTEVSFQNLKRPDPLFHEEAASAQEAIEIRRISPAGMFEIGQDKYSKTYEMVDINYTNGSTAEQIMFHDTWGQIYNAFHVPIKITIYNKKRSVRNLYDNVYYKMQGDLYDEARERYNDIMRSRIIDDKQGIEQRKYLTLVLQKNGGCKEAEKAMTSLETGYIKEYEGIGCKLIPLSGDERLTMLREFYRNDDGKVCIESCIEQGTDWRNEVCPAYSDWTNAHARHIELNGKYIRTMYIDPHSYGDSIEDSFFRELASLAAESIITLDVVPVPKSLTLKVLDNRYMAVEKKIVKQQQKRNKQKNFSSEISYVVQQEKSEINQMLDAVRKNGQKQFWVGISIAICADTLEELESHTNTIAQICDSGNCRLAIYTDMQREGLNTVLPLGVRNSSFMRAMFTSSVAAFIPFHVQELYDDSFQPFFYGVNKDSKNPIIFSRKNLDNPNGFIFGIPGSGKSMTGSKFEIGSVFLTTPDDIIIIDPQSEYKDVVNAFGGSYIDFAPDSQEHINVFHCSLEQLRADANVVIDEKQELMLGIMEKIMDGELPAGIKTVVERCVRTMYMTVLELPPAEQYIPIMSHFYAVAKSLLEEELQQAHKISSNAAEQMVLAVERFLTGNMSVFNKASNVQMDNRIMAFGIARMPKSHWGMTMSIMLSFIKNKVMDNFRRGKSTWIYMDECHYMAKEKYTRDFLVEAWKTYRKFSAILTGLTQNMIDLLKDDDTTTMVSNSQYMMLLKQSENDINDIVRALPKISETQLRFIVSAPKGTGILRYGNMVISMDARIDKDNPIYDVFNTNPHEKIVKKHQENKKEGDEKNG